MELREFKRNKPLKFEDLEVGEKRSSNYKDFFEGILHRKNEDIVEVKIVSLDSNKTILTYQKNLTEKNFKILEIENENWSILIDGKNVDTVNNNIFAEISVNFANNHPIAILKLKT